MGASPFFGIEIGLRAINAYKLGLEVISQNVANANTEGYSRQKVNLTATDPYTQPSFNRPLRPGQVGTGAIHHFVVRAIKNEPIEIHNDGDQIRAWCYIDDLIDGLIQTLEKDKAIGKIFNIGNPRTAVTVHSLASLIVRLAGSSSVLEHVDWPHPDVELRIPDRSRAKELLDFEPRYDLEDGLRLTIEWYRGKVT